MKKAALIFALIFFVSSCIKKENGLPNDATGNSGLAKTTLVDISYGSHVRQTYDIHLPAGRDSNTPVILMIHGDRKSTRLNSSHVRISYAVFCLKKKTI